MPNEHNSHAKDKITEISSASIMKEKMLWGILCCLFERAATVFFEKIE